MRFTWDEAKRNSNIQDHGLDFIDAKQVFFGPTFTFEDSRFSYGEERFVTLGMLTGFIVSIVHTETPHTIRIIPFARPRTMADALLQANPGLIGRVSAP